jgi:hypothetical protein
MVRKRPRGVVDISSPDISENEDLNDVQCSQPNFMDYDSFQTSSDAMDVSDVSVLFVFLFLDVYVYYFKNLLLFMLLAG